MEQTVTNKYPITMRSLRGLISALFLEFILGVLLTTVISYDPNKHSATQTTVLVAHVVVAVGLLVGSIAHIFVARNLHVLGPKPTIGFLCIVGAFISGGAAVPHGNSLAVMCMAFFFGAAIINYGLSYIALRVKDGAK